MHPIDELSAVIRSDDDYAWTVHCNIAMAAFDEGLEHSKANVIAARVMKVLFGAEFDKYKAH